MSKKAEPERVETPPAEGAIVLQKDQPETPLTPEQLAEGDKAWRSAMEEFKRKEHANLESLLTNNWEKGRFIESLIREKARYGNRTVDTFATEMRISREMTYAYQKFYIKFSTAELAEAIGMGVSWHVLFNLLSLQEGDKSKRRELMQLAATHKIDIEELKKRAASVNVATKAKLAAAGKKVDRRGGANIGTTFRSTTSICFQTCAKADEFIASVREYAAVTEPVRKAELAERLKEARNALKTTGEKIAQALKRLDDLK